MLAFNNIHFRKGKTNILHGISATIAPQKITALIGPNGSGKSALLSILSGLEHANQGNVTLQKKPLQEYARKALAQKLAFLPQINPTPASLTVKDLVAFGRHPYTSWYAKPSHEDKRLINWAMEQCQVQQYADTLLMNLSGGELQRCWLAMILAQDTPLIFLDEPTSWLDIPHQIILLEIVKRLNEEHKKTIVWVLHDLNQARQYSHDALLISQGELVASGTSDQVITKDNINHVYGINMQEYAIDQQTILWPK